MLRRASWILSFCTGCRWLLLWWAIPPGKIFSSLAHLRDRILEVVILGNVRGAVDSLNSDPTRHVRRLTHDSMEPPCSALLPLQFLGPMVPDHVRMGILFAVNIVHPDIGELWVLVCHYGYLFYFINPDGVLGFWEMMQTHRNQ